MQPRFVICISLSMLMIADSVSAQMQNNRKKPRLPATQVALQAQSRVMASSVSKLKTVFEQHGLDPANLTSDESRKAAAALGIPVTILAEFACLFGVTACMLDVQEMVENCLHENCPAGQSVDVDVCAAVAKMDFLGCGLSCGANGPDKFAYQPCRQLPDPPRQPKGPFNPPGGGAENPSPPVGRTSMTAMT